MKVRCEWLRIKEKKARLIINRKPNLLQTSQAQYWKVTWSYTSTNSSPIFSVDKRALKDSSNPQLDGISFVSSPARKVTTGLNIWHWYPIRDSFQQSHLWFSDMRLYKIPLGNLEKNSNTYTERINLDNSHGIL